MITKAIVSFFLGIITWLLDRLPAVPSNVTDGVGGFTGRLDSILAYVSKFSPLIDFSAIGASAVLFGAFVAFALGLQVARSAASYVTLGGGGV